MQNKQDLPPYVKFVQRSVEDRSTQLVAGKYGWKTVDFAEITRPGSNETVEREVEPWLLDMEKRVVAGLVPQTWLEHFQRSYAAWKQGLELPEDGTPIRMWPAINPAQVEQLLHLQIRTVEALAALDAPALSRIGLGAVELQQRARTWLAAAQDTGVAAAKIEALEVENAALKARLDDLARKFEQLAAKEPA